MFHFQTPQKEHLLANRRSSPPSDYTKKSHKIRNKYLNSVITSTSEDVSSESPKESNEFSSSLEISDDNQFSESAEVIRLYYSTCFAVFLLLLKAQSEQFLQ
ncbi:unnamed protein product [Ilex paraguariensis]|uniref:Uncharacterized protein n=1 Tax=Ilex paraguariensis TaxID=185542 RepID=A0ABC8R1L4_9AQUA